LHRPIEERNRKLNEVAVTSESTISEGCHLTGLVKMSRVEVIGSL